SGPPAGLTLAEAVRKFGPELCGSAWREPRFPFLCKYLFTSGWLSVQVHPDDDYARAHKAGSPGKCEMWYIVRAGRGAKLILGTVPRATKAQFGAALAAGSSGKLLRRLHPRAEEAFFIPPGAVHALGPHLVLFEAEQNSDITYRLDDFGRLGLDGKPRAVHLDKGLEVSRLDLSLGHLPRIAVREPFGTRRYIVASRHFAVEELTLRTRATFQGKRERIEMLSVVEGEGRVETTGQWMGYRTGETWLIPPATAHYRLVPRARTRILKVYLPDVEKDFRKPLAAHGKSRRKILQITFDGSDHGC
ncbi:MAG: class I mannose-6-phosphate isomerase, partial [Deltaproteobacteria bacterium]